jgi:type VI secretion system secreted protein Hcp
MMRSRPYASMGLVVASLLATATLASAAIETYLKIDGITGESTSTAHPGEIQLLSFSVSLMQEGGAAFGGGGGAGKVSVPAVQVTKRVDSVSVPLFLACVTGKHAKTARLSVAKTGDKSGDFLILSLEDVLVSGCAVSGQAADMTPTEQISLSASKIAWEYHPQKPDGSFGPSVKAGWDAKANQITELPAVQTPVAAAPEAAPGAGAAVAVDKPKGGLLEVIRRGGAVFAPK